MFADEPLSNDQTLTWLSNKLGKKKATIENWLQKYILTISIPETWGRKNLPAETRQKMFDAWYVNTVITVDRRNGRDYVNLSLKDYEDTSYNDLLMPEDIKLENFTSKRNQAMVRCI